MNETAEPFGNVAEHMAYGLRFYDGVTSHGLAGLARVMEHPDTRYYPPLMYLVSLPFQMLLGRGHEAMIASMLAYVVLLFVAVYGLARQVTTPFGAWCAAVLATSMPGIAYYERTFYPSVGLAALVALAMYALLRSERYSSLTWTLVLAIAVALGMWMKWTFFLYLVAPVGYVALRALPGEGRLSRAQNLAIGMLVCVNLLLPWYLPRASDIIAAGLMAHEQHQEMRYGGLDAYSVWGGLTYYWGHLSRGILGLPLTAATLVGAAVALYRRRDGEIACALAIGASLLIFSVHSVNFGRYLIPMAGVAAALGAAGLARARWPGTLLLGALTAAYAVIPLLWFYAPWMGQTPWLRPTENNYMDHGIYRSDAWLWLRVPSLAGRGVGQALEQVDRGVILLLSEQVDRVRYVAMRQRPRVSLELLDGEGRLAWYHVPFSGEAGWSQPLLVPEPDFILLDASIERRDLGKPWVERAMDMPLVGRFRLGGGPANRWFSLYRVPTGAHVEGPGPRPVQ